MKPPRRKRPKRWVILLICGLGFLMFTTIVPWPTWRRVAPSHAPDFSQRTVNTDLTDAVADDDLPKVQKLLDAGASPNSTTEKEGEGRTALSVAAETDDVRMVELLLGRGADINACDFWGGNAITSAAVWGNAKVLALLISRGGDVNADDDGASALGYAENIGLTESPEQKKLGYASCVFQLKRAGARLFSFLPL